MFSRESLLLFQSTVRWNLSEHSHVSCMQQNCLRVSIPAKNIMTRKKFVEERVYSAYTFHIAVHHQGKSGLELKQVRKQELMQRPWRDVSYWLAQLALL